MSGVVPSAAPPSKRVRSRPPVPTTSTDGDVSGAAPSPLPGPESSLTVAASPSQPASSPPLTGISLLTSSSSSEEQPSSTSSLSQEAADLRIGEVMARLGKMLDLDEVYSTVLANADAFMHCSAHEARRYWNAIGLKGSLKGMTRQVALDTIRQLLNNIRQEATEESNAGGSEPDEGDDDVTAPTSPVHQSRGIIIDPRTPPSKTRRSDRVASQRGQQRELYQEACRRLDVGQVLSAAELQQLHPHDREKYQRQLTEQAQALKELQQRQRSLSGAVAAQSSNADRLVSSSAPAVSSASSAPSHSVHWQALIPSVDASHSVPGRSSSSRHQSADAPPRAGKKRKRSRQSRHRSSRDHSSDSSISSDSSTSTDSGGGSSPSTSDEELGSTSSTTSSSDSEPSSPQHRSSRSHRHGGERHRRRRTERISVHGDDGERPPRRLRHWLRQKGIATSQRFITSELTALFNGQTPMQWWRNLINAFPPGTDPRTVNEGLCLALCLEAGDHVVFMREAICRRLLGLQMVLTAANKKDAWIDASALLPLNPSSSVSLKTQRMIDKEARRIRRLTSSSSASSQRSSSPRGYNRRGRSGGRSRHGQGGHRNGYDSGYNSGADRPSGGSGRSNSRRGGGGNGNNRGNNNQSGAASASAQRGSSAGGSGANQQ